MVEAKFSIGQLITHSLYGYRGVIIDADPCFTLSDSWYNKMATSKPAKDQPWYHILVNNSSIQTYVSESSLEADFSEQAIQLPMVDLLFSGKSASQYKLSENLN